MGRALDLGSMMSILYRETHSSEDTWHYQLLLGFTNPLEE